MKMINTDMNPLKNPSKLGLGEKTSLVSRGSNGSLITSLLLFVLTVYPNSYIPHRVKISMLRISRTKKYLRFARADVIFLSN